ncbi:hypothetical protein [Mesorhizobium sp. ESP-6-2]|uniref:hypothetical protein n=1 Tax=Mesorhizobium sp. ESP-6-2 TaxID=2876625 RepID=UPI001CCDF4E3|nr:hypothetical protein [Mesorhizobium sp. ESP-6-2]MBZ9808317.1 hypothetical protein [Mesorhizobium sp. ESP-6-2]
MSDDKTKPRRSFFPIRIYLRIGNGRPKKAKEEELFYPPGWNLPLTRDEMFQWRLARFIAWVLVIGAWVAGTIAVAYGAAALVVYLAPFWLPYLQ